MCGRSSYYQLLQSAPEVNATLYVRACAVARNKGGSRVWEANNAENLDHSELLITSAPSADSYRPRNYNCIVLSN